MFRYSTITIIYNPKSTGDSPVIARDLHSQLTDEFPQCKIALKKTTHAGHADKLAYEAASLPEGENLIISVSGDGGYHEVINGALRAAQGHGTKPICAVAPGGNANDHFRNISSGSILDAVRKGVVQELDVLEVSYGKTQRYAHSYFGIGVTPAIAIELNKHSLSLLKESWLTLKTCWHIKPIEIKQDNSMRRYDSVIVSNVRTMAKYFTLSRKAKPNDGTLRILRWPHKTKLHLAAYIIRSAIGVPLKNQRASSFIFQTTQALPAQLDGEVIELPGKTSVKISILQRKLRTIL